jgi:phosphoglycolate phosphatase-like HAD superfamily hydrolase
MLDTATSSARVAVFDIDGTLTDTNAVDDECFLRAAAEVLGFEPREVDWSEAPHVTDAALLEWLCERCCGRTIREGEADATRRLFFRMLSTELAASPHRFRPIRGAEDVLTRVRSAGWEVAVATGGWETSARLKLSAIGLPHEGLAIASSSDARTRADIVSLAVARLLTVVNGANAAVGAVQRTPGRVVSIGDAVWDVRTAAAMALPFIGVATGARAERLRSAGARVVLEDLSDSGALYDALEHAPPPAGDTR